MDLNKFTKKSLEAIQEAQNIAIKNSNPDVNDIHLQYALVSDIEGVIYKSLSNQNIDVKAYLEELRKNLDSFPSQNSNSNIYPSTIFQRILLKSEDEAKSMGDEYISVEHLYMALLKEKKIPSEEILKKYNITLKGFKEGLKSVRGNQKVDSDDPESTYEALDKYGRDLTEEARQGKLDPVIGRDEEIRHCVRILSRRTKNNPVLIGEPGVGKTAVVEGLAQRIVKMMCRII